MKHLNALAILIVLSSMACASAQNATRDKVVVIKGQFKYEFGDGVQYDCGKSARCETVIVRDKYLQSHIVEIDGKNIVVEGIKIDACHDLRSTTFACVTSRDGTAFVVTKWVEPVLDAN